jgi:mRNA interferase RelE/StbE
VTEDAAWRVFVASTARHMLDQIADRRLQQTIVRRLRKQADEPEQQGKPLVAELSGYESIHAAGRYRIIYRFNTPDRTIQVVAIGIRREGDKHDVYALTKKLVRLGLLE